MAAKKTKQEIFLDEFTASYLHTAAWVECDSGENRDFTRQGIKIAKQDCQKFICLVVDKLGKEKGEWLLTIGGSDLQYLAAHDLYLTRNRHGSGFWDKPNYYGENDTILTDLAHQMGEAQAYHVRGPKSKLTF